MTKVCPLLALGIWVVSGLACLAGDEGMVPPPDSGLSSCASCKPASRPWTYHQRRFYDWLTYQPLERPGPCSSCRGCQCCTPPLYTFFLCSGCCGSDHVACRSCTACSSNGASFSSIPAAPVPPPVVQVSGSSCQTCQKTGGKFNLSLGTEWCGNCKDRIVNSKIGHFLGFGHDQDTGSDLP